MPKGIVAALGYALLHQQDCSSVHSVMKTSSIAASVVEGMIVLTPHYV
jgi:hypothetical protein